MSAIIEKFTISTKGFDDIVDITSKVQGMVKSQEIKNGIVNISSVSSCASIVVLENVPGLALDLVKLIKEIIPINQIYQHDNLWHDGNAFSHLRASILQKSLSLPVEDGKIVLGKYQQILLIDFDNKLSNNQVVLSIVG